jgi:hypothetical protein
MHRPSQADEVFDSSADAAITCEPRLFDLSFRPGGSKIEEEWSS